MTPQGVNGIVTGDAVPSEAAVRLFKLVLMAERPELVGAKMNTPTLREEEYTPGDWANELLNELRAMDDQARDEFIRCIRTLGKHVPKKKINYRKIADA